MSSPDTGQAMMDAYAWQVLRDLVALMKEQRVGRLVRLMEKS